MLLTIFVDLTTLNHSVEICWKTKWIQNITLCSQKHPVFAKDYVVGLDIIYAVNDEVFRAKILKKDTVTASSSP